MMNVRGVIALLVGVLLFGASLHAQDTLVVFERVGKVIDKYERNYFNLFPTVRGFSEGVLISQDSGKAALSVNGNFVLFLNVDMLRLLKQYVREYDAIRWGLREELSESNVNNHFSLLVKADVVLPFIPFVGSTVTVRIRSEGAASESSMTGELMYVDEHRVLVRPGDVSMNVDPVSITAADITSISTFQTAPERGAVVGVTIGGGLGVLFASAALASQKGPHTRDPISSSLVVMTIGAFGAGIFGAIGTALGLLAEIEIRREIEIPYDYHSILPELRRMMYYRYGLPPDSPWREK